MSDTTGNDRESAITLVAELLEFLGYAESFDGDGEPDYPGTADHVIGLLESAGYLSFQVRLEPNMYPVGT